MTETIEDHRTSCHPSREPIAANDSQRYLEDAIEKVERRTLRLQVATVASLLMVKVGFERLEGVSEM